MRNTSDPIKKENSNVMNAQGGEKKVMKKILSVALSTAMAFSMFASVAFGDTAVSPQQQFDALKAKGIFNGYPDGTAGLDKDMTRAEFAKVITKLLGLKEITGTLSYTDKNYTAKNWAVPYIEAVTAAGIMEGKNVEKKIFDFNGKVTVSEMATILTRALDLEIPAETNNTAPAWAKGYVQAAINAGLVDANTNFTANASRELLVGAAYSIDQAQSLKVSSYTVTEGGKVVEFKISDGETVKVTLDKALEANKETEVKFTYKDKNFTEKVTYVVEAATKVQSASATNLKEVDVAFDGKVDKATATDKNNYSVDSNSKGIKSITLLADGKTARLLLNESSKLTQGTTYKVLVKNVKSSTGTVVPQGEVSFTSADNTLPTVTEVKALGTKVIKVTFSEPVVAPTSSNFQLDDKAFVGNVTLGANQREVILRDYTGTISEGAHKLTTSLVEDFAGLKSLSATTDFTVAVDTEGPKVTEISATLEKVTVTFDEEIDPTSVTSESFYWKSGDSKKVGKATQIAANVYEVDFTENRLPGYETNLFVEVKDYSGNANSVKEHKVTASVDLVQPKVIDVAYGTSVSNELTVRFDKAVDAADVKYFSVKKGNDVIPVKSVYAAPGGDNKVFNVQFYSNLSGTYTLKVSGVQDKTALKNTVVTYESTFLASDSQAPKLVTTTGTDANNSNRRVALTFDRAIDLSTLNNRANYYIEFQKDNAASTQTVAIPVDVTLNVTNGGKTVVLGFPETIDGTDVTFKEGTVAGSVKLIKIAGLKSQIGQATGWIETLELVDTDLAITDAEQKDARTFVVKFNKTIANASTSDFAIGSGNVAPTSVTVDGNEVTLKTNVDFNGGNEIKTVRNNAIQTYTSQRIGVDGINTSDAVAPRVNLSSDAVIAQQNKRLVLPFTTDLETDNQADIANDLIIKKLGETNTPALNPIIDYTTTVEGKNVVVTIKPSVAYNSEYSVQVKDGATFIRTNNTDKTAAKSDVYRTTINETVADVVTAKAAITTSPVAEATASDAEAGLELSAKTVGAAANNSTITFNATLAPGAAAVVNATSITVASDADVDAVKAAVDAATGINYNAKVVGTALPTNGTVFTLVGGKDEVNGSVTVTLNKAIDSVTDIAITGFTGSTYNAVLSTDKKSFTVNVGQDNVAGKTITVEAVDVNGQDIDFSTAITSN
ncbi:hypothetical protein BS614_00105 [Paenibacillus xylanexedens]|uniref:S-layer homology domain-containing protein n=1 Tax=Paenibacillus xylanexedens TaxID=528191 RepID=UPI0009383902|nr:S-layer homology domain-containing protein [Paenibacillus xylanexedens]APO42630.1 hypothetical protein BS614_00105 [Paenibacillus xylanexedens]